MSEVSDRIRLVVLVTRDGQPELFEELEKRPPKYRTERLRNLAMMGLRDSKGLIPVQLADNPAAQVGQNTYPVAAAPSPKPLHDAVAEEEAAARAAEEAAIAKRRDRLKGGFRVDSE